MTRRINRITAEQPKTLLIAVYSPYNPSRDIRGYFDEFIHLVASNDISVDSVQEVRLRAVDPANFFTKGKLEELTSFASQGGFDRIIISEPLTVQQERNIRSFFRCPVIDRTRLILEIFEKRATSAEGKLQVKLALLQHEKSRLAGRGLYMSQQAGRIGTRGPGETQKEKDLQHIEHLMQTIRRDLKRLERIRNTQRKQRLQREMPLVCLVGYTNAGKSSLLNALTKSTVPAENQLFSTLDTTTRELYIKGTKIGLISDTVGFIQQLPHNLIEAFKSTLDELSYAHLIIHVVDISNPNWKSQIHVVNDIMQELGVDKPMVYVLNKSDLVSEAERGTIVSELSSGTYPIILTSTVAEHGLQELTEFLQQWHRERAA